LYIITGASRGIGLYLLKKFHNDNCEVIGFYNTTFPPNKLKNNYFQLDVTSTNKISNVIEKLKKGLNDIVLINCAGINYNSFAHKAVPNLWSNVIKINLIGSFNVINGFLPIMREQKYGRIINISSVVGQIGIPGTSAYAASKSGLWGMTRSISIENAKNGVTINNINLGYFDIGMIQEVPDKYQSEIKNKIPLGQFGHPKEIYSTIKYIVNSDYLTGTSINLNGGLI
jgi:NAD(P)-dependent dehydrogenase (short-subunit alcohol dehydrogenase family)